MATASETTLYSNSDSLWVLDTIITKDADTDINPSASQIYEVKQNGQTWSYTPQYGYDVCSVCCSRLAFVNFCENDKHFYCAPCLYQYIEQKENKKSTDNKGASTSQTQLTVDCPTCRKIFSINEAKNNLAASSKNTFIDNIILGCRRCNEYVPLSETSAHLARCTVMNNERFEELSKRFSEKELDEQRKLMEEFTQKKLMEERKQRELIEQKQQMSQLLAELRLSDVNIEEQAELLKHFESEKKKTIKNVRTPPPQPKQDVHTCDKSAVEPELQNIRECLRLRGQQSVVEQHEQILLEAIQTPVEPIAPIEFIQTPLEAIQTPQSARSDNQVPPQPKAAPNPPRTSVIHQERRDRQNSCLIL